MGIHVSDDQVLISIYIQITLFCVVVVDNIVGPDSCPRSRGMYVQSKVCAMRILPPFSSNAMLLRPMLSLVWIVHYRPYFGCLVEKMATLGTFRLKKLSSSGHAAHLCVLFAATQALSLCCYFWSKISDMQRCTILRQISYLHISKSYTQIIRISKVHTP